MSGHEPFLPPVGPDGLRHWQVAGGVLVDDRGVLLVQNKRRNGDLDWSTPGGVVDPGETPLEGLTREVAEETGIQVAAWDGPVYRVEVLAPDAGFFLVVEAHRAASFAGTVAIEDPDGIVIGAEFFDLTAAGQRLGGAPPWVAEPLLAHLTDGIDDGRLFRYRVDGRSRTERTITRDHDG